MLAHLKYLRYILRHKWFVYVAGLRVGAPIWRLLIHDWSKFLPSEWFAYTHYFYGTYPSWEFAKRIPTYEWKHTKEGVNAAFQRAWLHHIHWNKHHWQYWIMIDDPTSATDLNAVALPMPKKYALEMIADWCGAGRAINGRIDVSGWYWPRRDRITLHPDTRMFVEDTIQKMKW
ncbi:MAG: hypothetical protein KGL39_48200 [Patescibacteria group bacterium]|nr:hypothetical protein [Patescibacteria group bacterium]